MGGGSKYSNVHIIGTIYFLRELSARIFYKGTHKDGTTGCWQSSNGWLSVDNELESFMNRLIELCHTQVQLKLFQRKVSYFLKRPNHNLN